MTRKRTRDAQPIRRVLDRLATDRKRTVLAASLMFLMGFMWFRVLTGQKPGPAAAAPQVPGAPQPSADKPLNARFFTLPDIPGRNDCIHRDFFAGGDWAPFRDSPFADNRETPAQVQVTADDRAQEVTVRIAQTLKLEAVLWSENPQENSRAFINDQLLRVGDQLTAKDGTDARKFEVLRIHEDSVLIGCNGARLTLKLAQHLDVRK